MSSEPRLLDVSPDIAGSWLSAYWSPIPDPWPYSNGAGLRLVKSFIGFMRADKWLSTPRDPIKLTNMNELLDGRARLLAVYRCGITVQMAVAGGYYYEDWFKIHRGVASMLMYPPGAQ